MRQQASVHDLRNEHINSSTFNMHTKEDEGTIKGRKEDEGTIRGKKMKLQEEEEVAGARIRLGSWTMEEGKG